MKQPLWAKANASMDERTMRFMAGRDVHLDQHLLPFDIQATRAHVAGLADINALSGDTASTIDAALEQMLSDIDAGKFILDDRYEDGHSAIEDYLVSRVGEDGKRVHLGRSRNDQVLVALRLYMKDALTRAALLSLDAADAALQRARAHEFDPMPGYTHMQRAVPSSIGLWMASFAEGFCSSASLLRLTRSWIDECPLGTAAGYGVNIDLPREHTTERLAFERTLLNPMHAQATRGSSELQVLSALWQPAQIIRRLAWDLVLFSTAEFGFVSLPPAATTGSSIMPNKHNPDLPELLRGIAPIISGCMTELQCTLALPSGYHRDLQHTKEPLIRGVTTLFQALELIPDLISNTTFNLDRMRSAIDPSMYATDDAVQLAIDGHTFRDAYRHVADNLDALDNRDPAVSIKARSSLGATGNLALAQIEARITALRTDL